MTDSKKIAAKNLARLLSQWGEEFTLFVPSRVDDVATMTRWGGKDAGFLNWHRNSTVPPKSSFLPPVEEMFSFGKDRERYKLELPPSDEKGKLIFGIRSCDARALAILDNVFKDTYEDPYYLGRRRYTILVGLGCINPYDSCFCTSVGGGPGDSSGLDIMFTDIGDAFLVQGITARGKRLLARSSLLAKATKGDENRARKSREAAGRKVTRKIDTGDIEKRLLKAFNDHDYWQKIARKCISCGICTLLCPTCHCFDINDEMKKGQGSRYRSLDSCSFTMYTRMPMENPRAEKWRRVRNKLCHKYEFFPMLFDMIACTGCGRCIRLCPVNWDITRAIESIPAEK